MSLIPLFGYQNEAMHGLSTVATEKSCNYEADNKAAGLPRFRSPALYVTVA